jgi:hypothetical protein
VRLCLLYCCMCMLSLVEVVLPVTRFCVRCVKCEVWVTLGGGGNGGGGAEALAAPCTPYIACTICECTSRFPAMQGWARCSTKPCVCVCVCICHPQPRV